MVDTPSSFHQGIVPEGLERGKPVVRGQTGEKMKSCSACGATYTEYIEFCFVDGQLLDGAEVRPAQKIRDDAFVDVPMPRNFTPTPPIAPQRVSAPVTAPPLPRAPQPNGNHSSSAAEPTEQPEQLPPPPPVRDPALTPGGGPTLMPGPMPSAEELAGIAAELTPSSLASAPQPVERSLSVPLGGAPVAEQPVAELPPLVKVPPVAEVPAPDPVTAVASAQPAGGEVAAADMRLEAGIADPEADEGRKGLPFWLVGGLAALLIGIVTTLVVIGVASALGLSLTSGQSEEVAPVPAAVPERTEPRPEARERPRDPPAEPAVERGADPDPVAPLVPEEGTGEEARPEERPSVEQPEPVTARPKPQPAADVVAPAPERESFEPWAEVDNTPSTSKVRLSSVPEGAIVKIDGKRAGKTPLAVDLAYGSHEFEFSLRGHVVMSKRVEVRTESLSIPAALEVAEVAPVAPAPVVPAPVAPAPVVPAPVAPAPVAPAPVAPAPTAGQRSGPVFVFFPGRDGDGLRVDGKTAGTLPARVVLTEGSHVFEIDGPNGQFKVTKEVVFAETGTLTLTLGG